MKLKNLPSILYPLYFIDQQTGFRLCKITQFKDDKLLLEHLQFSEQSRGDNKIQKIVCMDKFAMARLKIEVQSILVSNQYFQVGPEWLKSWQGAQPSF